MKKTIKIYEEQGQKYQFSSEELSVLINQRKHLTSHSDKKATKGSIMEELANLLFVSSEAIKNWMYGYNGPSDLEQVKKIAAFFDVDYHRLLNQEDNKMNNNNSIVVSGSTNQTVYTREIVRDLYLSMLGVIDSVEWFWDLMSSYPEFYPSTHEDFIIEKDAYEKAMQSSLADAKKKLERSLLDIPETLYSRLETYIWSVLENLVSQVTDYKFNPQDEDDLPTYEESVYIPLCDYYEDRKYMRELRDLFQDYIVR